MCRPGLLADIEDGLVDVVVVYKIDRLSRSLMDFSKLVEVFDRNGVTFVSVTQSFNTTTSMGRLTLNILLSFAQFEREVTAERIRDKVRASRMKGMWMGGCPPLGYVVKDRKLVENPADAAHVRWVFARFVEIGSPDAGRDRSGPCGGCDRCRPGWSGGDATGRAQRASRPGRVPSARRVSLAGALDVQPRPPRAAGCRVLRRAQTAS